MILITGGAGYIGSHAVRLFLENGYEVVVVDNLSRGYKEAIETLKQFGDLHFEKLDIRDKESLDEVFNKYKVEGVLHFAALCTVTESVENPGLYFENNVVGSLNLLDLMEKYEVDKLVFSSTSEVYGESEYLPIDEEHPLDPVNPYGLSKLMVENMIEWYGRAYGLKYSILRYFNVCGASSDGKIGDSKKPSTLLMQNAVRGAMGIDEFFLTCPKVDTRDGTPVRDYIDVEDLVEAHLAVYDHISNNGNSDVFNLGNGKGYTVKEIVSMVEEVFGIDMNAQQAEPRKGEVAEKYTTPEKINSVVGWSTKKSLEESIRSLKKWYEGHTDGWGE